MNKGHSIQRMIKLESLNLDEHAHTYFDWLPSIFVGLIKVDKTPNLASVSIKFFRWSLLRLQRNLEKDGVYFEVVGGVLSLGEGSFYFKEEGQVLITALENFSPRLPWPIYRFTQYPIHDLVMFLYSEHLRTLGLKDL